MKSCEEMIYKYETHLHTAPVSGCGKCSVRENMEFYKELGYDGIFITNHFLDGKIGIDASASYEEKINFYFSDYEQGKLLEEEIGIKVFCGVEISYEGTDFLIYGLDKEWYLANKQIMAMDKRTELLFMKENGAFIIHAHPYREDSYIDHIRLYPGCVDGVEVINANRRPLENKMADIYAENYGLIKFAGSDNHVGRRQDVLAGVYSQKPILSEDEFIESVKNGDMSVFTEKNALYKLD